MFCSNFPTSSNKFAFGEKKKSSKNKRVQKVTISVHRMNYLRSQKLLSVSDILQVQHILLFCNCTTLSKHYGFQHVYQSICHFPSSQPSDISFPCFISHSLPHKGGNKWITRHISYIVHICLRFWSGVLVQANKQEEQEQSLIK